MIISEITKGKTIGIQKVQILGPRRNSLSITSLTSQNQEGMVLRIFKVTPIQLKMVRALKRRGCLRDATLVEEITILTNAMLRSTPINHLDHLDHHSNIFISKGFTRHLTIDKKNNR